MALLSGALLIAVGLLKYTTSKLDKVEHELDMHDKKKEMEDKQDVFEAKVMEDETIALLKEVDLNAKKSRDERNSNL